MDNITNLLITIFFGLFGVHKFIKGDKKMGFIYLFTLGLFGMGWIYDVVMAILRITNGINPNSLMPKEAFEAIKNGKLPNIQGTNLNLSKDEICCYMDKAYTFKDKTITTGYKGGHGGFSFRIMKGISYRTGQSESHAVRQTTRTTYNGLLYLTSNRVVYSSESISFDKTFDKITSIAEVNDGLVIQIGSNTYSIVVETHKEFMIVFNLLKQIEKDA